MNRSRRHFLRHAAAVSTGFLGLNRFLEGSEPGGTAVRYGPLQPDPEGFLDLPTGFRYRILSTMGDPMEDGYKVPGQPDGMAAFPAWKNRVVLVRNHEIGLEHLGKGPFEDDLSLPKDFDRSMVYDPGDDERRPFLGGTTNLVYDPNSGKVESQFISLLGTDRNCAGGPTPWGSWITCEEPTELISPGVGENHGYCFEVPAQANRFLAQPEPLRAMGRFRHEAVAVDPGNGIVYLTEDRYDGLIYRFLPDKPGDLRAGGRLQALGLKNAESADTAMNIPIGVRLPVSWIDLEDVESRDDMLRIQGFDLGAARFTRGEGMWYGSRDQVGDAAVYWCCTDGGRDRQGQIFRYFPSPKEGQSGEMDRPGEMELYLEPNDSNLLRNGDNITIAPWGDLVICEDTKGSNAIRAVTPEGRFYTLALNVKNGSEFAGACFSPGGETLFVNIQASGETLAITGPWK